MIILCGLQRSQVDTFSHDKWILHICCIACHEGLPSHFSRQYSIVKERRQSGNLASLFAISQFLLQFGNAIWYIVYKGLPNNLFSVLGGTINECCTTGSNK